MVLVAEAVIFKKKKKNCLGYYYVLLTFLDWVEWFYLNMNRKSVFKQCLIIINYYYFIIN